MSLLNVKIIGAGSVGNHLANAFRSFRQNVTLTDIDKNALERTRFDIYPSRYGTWDKEISLGTPNDFKNKKFDIVVIGTPPDTHFNIALNEIEKAKKAILVEKPLCTPDSLQIQGFEKLNEQFDGRIFVGYNHSVSNMITCLRNMNILETFDLGEVKKINVFWQESWEGILLAHPWLNGAEETYLGFSQRGGGALGEHSHGLKLLLDISRFLGLSHPNIIDKQINWHDNYDITSSVFFDYEKSEATAHYITDVISWPAKKGAEVIFKNGKLIIEFGNHSDGDMIRIFLKEQGDANFQFSKTRPYDFQLEVKNILNSLINKTESTLDLKNCLMVQHLISKCLEKNL